MSRSDTSETDALQLRASRLRNTVVSQGAVSKACDDVRKALIALPQLIKTCIRLLKRRLSNKKQFQKTREPKQGRVEVGSGASRPFFELVDELGYDMCDDFCAHPYPLSLEQLLEANEALVRDCVLLFGSIPELLQIQIQNKDMTALRKQVLACVTCILVTHHDQDVLMFRSVDQEDVIQNKAGLDMFVTSLLLAEVAAGRSWRERRNWRKTNAEA